MKVQEHFQQTIQGEGFWAGTPADFIRLYGCPVKCPWCDTGYSDGGIGLHYEGIAIADLINALKSPMVVITGGEPMIHKDLPLLVRSIIDSGRKVSIETSGSYWQEVDKAAWVTLSPKEHTSNRFPVLDNAWLHADEVKIVINDGSEVEFYRDNLSEKSCPIYLQPEWSTKERTIQMALSLLKENPTYRLSLQMHKLIGVP